MPPYRNSAVLHVVHGLGRMAQKPDFWSHGTMDSRIGIPVDFTAAQTLRLMKEAFPISSAYFLSLEILDP